MNSVMYYTLILLSILQSGKCYIRAKNQHTHINHIHSHNYVLSVIISSQLTSKTDEQIHRILSHLKDSSIVKSHSIILELSHVNEIPQLERRYKLKGKNTVKFFIRKKMHELTNFDELLDRLDKGSVSENEMSTILEEFMQSHLDNVSIPIKSFDHFQKFLIEKKVIGVFFGHSGKNFENYLHVARKNLDFDFSHTHDEKLKKTILDNFKYDKIPTGDFFAIIRHESALNEFDHKSVVLTGDFNEKSFTEFVDFERFDKLRDPVHGLDIVKRMFVRSQPLVLYTKGSDDETEGFKAFKEAVKALSKRFIFSYVELNSGNSSNFTQLFTTAENKMQPESLSIIYITLARKPKVMVYEGFLASDKMKEFVLNFYDEHKHILDSLTQHLYDNKNEEIRPVTEDL